MKIASLIVTITVLASYSCSPDQRQQAIEGKTACDTPMIYLSEWHSDKEAGLVTEDPAGGYIFLYWIDEQGNACHGEPGESAIPGAYVIRATSDSAYLASLENTTADDETLKRWQVFSFDGSGYKASGLHFAQFDNVTWRSRKDEFISKDKEKHAFAVPQVVETGKPFCLAPRFDPAMTGSRHDGYLLAAGDSAAEKIACCPCLKKVQPSSADMQASEISKYSAGAAPYGLRISE